MTDPVAFIPYGFGFSSPFAKWQGSLASSHAIELAAATLADRIRSTDLDPSEIDLGILGTTIPQKGAFYGLPWLASQAGLGHLAGPTIAQACATGARVVDTAARLVADGEASAVLCMTADKTSNSPHIYYPDPSGPGGVGETENWVLANFDADPATGLAMIDTAENAARRYSVSKEEQDEIVLMRYAQYEEALKDDRRFHRRFMLPVSVGKGRRSFTLDADEGATPANEEKIRSLRPVREGGTVTFAGQTHPADGHAGLLVTSADKAKALSTEKITVALLGFGQARTEPAYMPEAPVPASRRALERAGLHASDLTLVSSHNPFAVNDAVFSREMNVPLQRMNVYGSSLVFGHPQAPTGMRLIIELIEALAERGGGYGLFQGCAAGDSAMALVIKVDDGR
ncbi:MAG: thiolase family protein [Parvularcula sp.]|jgi:acetyl-CoA acetyltransferase family protein|nr:thiolase family protein [Parvularcula sp.]